MFISIGFACLIVFITSVCYLEIRDSRILRDDTRLVNECYSDFVNRIKAGDRAATYKHSGGYVKLYYHVSGDDSWITADVGGTCKEYDYRPYSVKVDNRNTVRLEKLAINESLY